MEEALTKPVNCRRLNRNQIKYIAIIAMLADHIAWAVWAVSPFLWACMHFIGRLTGPTMAYFYLIYPAHLAVIGLLRWGILR